LSKPSPPPLLSVRTAVILLLGVLCGAAVTALTALAEHNLTTAMLAGLAAAGAAIAFFQKVIGPDSSSPLKRREEQVEHHVPSPAADKDHRGNR
jgi:hypothetical protein